MLDLTSRAWSFPMVSSRLWPLLCKSLFPFLPAPVTTSRSSQTSRHENFTLLA